MKPTQRLACLLATVFTVSAASAQLAEEYRQWTNTAGKQIEATLIAVDAVARSVKIKMKDGKEYDVPIASLSPADFEYAKTRYAAMQAAAAAPATAPAMPAGTPPATAGTPPAPAPAKGKGKGAPVVPSKPAPPRPQITVVPAAKYKAPAANDYLGGIAKVRPRLIQNAAGWAAIKNQIAADPALTKLMTTLKASGEDLLKDPELNRINGEIQGTVSEGSRAIYRMALLGALHYGDGDLKWKERGVREVILLCDKTNFRDWHPAEAGAVADMVIAVTLGYDWFRDGYNATQAAEIRTFLRQKGVDALIAHIQDEPVPPTAFGTAPGASDDKKKAPAKGKGKAPAKEEELPVNLEKMHIASALLLNAIGFVDDDPDMAKASANAAAKVFGEGMLRFAPAGIWPEGMVAGDAVMDYAAMVVQSLRSASGKDFGLSMLEGIPQFGFARMHLYGPTGQPFNFGDGVAGGSVRPWITTWLAGLHGNPGIPAMAAGAKMAASTSYFNQVGHYLYYNPHAAGDGTPDAFEFATAGGIAATVRSGWGKEDLYIAAKGGDNRDLHAQLDVGTFVLDAGGVRWGLELGAESDRVGGFEPKPGADRTKRYELFLEGTKGQSTLTFGGGNQELDARAGVLVTQSTPEAGLAVIDMTKAYDKDAKDVHRGIMVVRGATPYLVMQDDMNVKNTQQLAWSMQTKDIEITVDGPTATLKKGDKQLIATIVSPKGAVFSADEPPPPTDLQNGRKLGTKTADFAGENVKILKATVADAKGDVSLCITFTTGPAAPAHTHTPISAWVKKK